MESFENLYIHFPYCETKCHYCDFFSLPENKYTEEERAEIYRAILKERSQFELSPLKTVFIGGGTPSLVPVQIMRDLFNSIPITGETEITMEANPSSITLEKAREWKKIGIKRISMGVQALDNERLKWLSRVHSKEEVFRALDILHEAEIPAISIDYIVGVPGQTVQVIEEEIRNILTRYPNLKHLSAYLLTLQRANGKFKELPSDEEQLKHLHAIRDTLAEFGFSQYEISNFARDNAVAKHNENYWLGGSYLGIGPSAHSFSKAKKMRWKNWASLSKYEELVTKDMPALEWSEILDAEQARIEFIMLRLRRRDGFCIEDYNTLFDRDLMKERKNWIEILQEKNLCKVGLENGKTRLSLTSDGFFISDQIYTKLI